MILADTSFIIDIMKGKNDAKKKHESISSNNQHILVSTISIYELYIGVAKCGLPDKEEKKIRNALSKLITADFDENSAKEAGRINVELEKKGQRIDSIDVLIAGTARAKGIPVITRNVTHFVRVDGLIVESY